MAENVNAWVEDVEIPTYGIGKPEKNPMFLERRVYQGSSGVVYPYPVIEKIYDTKEIRKWKAVFLENRYLKIMILPELGGRIQMAYDKIKQRHFIYYNQVIKPALVGLTGPWISGGIEFNWPQHHRPSTFLPVEYSIEKNSDKSITVWCSELERMFRTKGMAGFTLHPDRAYLEIKVKLYNRTDLPQTFLWWANPAVKVNDDYQSVFPPDVNAVFDHGKRDVSEFPIAKGTYYKVDYSPGTDISRYKNIPVPTSYMAITSKYDFVGGYENDTKGGLLHVANHHVSPGKKQWTWGNSDFGQAWDRNLTDEDGPYIELMCGVFTDNQPDFSWLMPGEEKSFTQYFMPYRDLGVVKNANKDALVNLEIKEGGINIKAYTTSVYPQGKVVLKKGQEIILEDIFDFSPELSYEKNISASCSVLTSCNVNLSELELIIFTNKGNKLIGWKPEPITERTVPEPAKPAKFLQEVESNEQLFLTALHLEQYRHATYDPRPYYDEALRRDNKDYRCNNALGLWHLRRGKFKKAEDFFLKAIETITERNPNPIDGEPFFNLGLALRLQGKDDEAFGYFYKSVWNAAWMDSGYFQLARIAASRGDIEEALEFIDRSLNRNCNHHKARNLKVSLLRKLGRKNDAITFADQSLALDNFNMGVHYEKLLLNEAHIPNDTYTSSNTNFSSNINIPNNTNIHSYIEFSLDYAFAGFYEEALQLLKHGITCCHNEDYPMAWYFIAWYEWKLGSKVKDSRDNEAIKSRDELVPEALKKAAKACPDYCFPNRIEDVIVLEWAKTRNTGDAKAPYYLGNFWYNARQYEEAIKNWELSASIDNTYPTVFRNLALAYFNKQSSSSKALDCLETAFRLNPADARVLMELDQLYKRLAHTAQERLDFLNNYRETVNERDDLYLEYSSLIFQTGNPEKAYDLLMKRKFHPWEGGEGKVTGLYIDCLVAMARKTIDTGDFKQAVDLLSKARVYPENLGEGKLFGAQENSVLYWLGTAYEGLKEYEKARIFWEEASFGLTRVSSAFFYNDQQPETIFYQGLALLKSGKREEAEKRFKMLIDYGREHINDNVQIDYFAVSLPDLQIWEEDLNERNKRLCTNLIELGEQGLRTES